jgi:hypothetical protein
MNDNKNTLGWLSLVTAVAALFVAIVAYNRAGIDIGEVVQRNVEEAQERVEREANDIDRDAGLAVARVDASVRLANLRTQIENDALRMDAVDEVRRTRENLAEAYAGAQGALLDEWNEINNEMGNLEVQIGVENDAAIGTINRLLDLLR